MSQRRVTEQQVEAVLKDHHIKYHDAEGNDILIGDIDGFGVKVVVKKGSNPPFIITVADRQAG